MGLFGKKKYTPDEILELINGLPENERAELKGKFDDLYKAEDEREIDKIEEDKADSPETADEKAEEVSEESEEIGKDVDEIEKEGEEDIQDTAEDAETVESPEAPTEEADAPTEDTEEPAEPASDPVEQDNTAEMIKALTDRLDAVEALVGELNELKTAMDEYVSKQKDAFGYRSEASGQRKSYEDMTADELKHHILNN